MSTFGLVAGVSALALSVLAWIAMQSLPSAVLVGSFAQPPPTAMLAVANPQVQTEPNHPADPKNKGNKVKKGKTAGQGGQKRGLRLLHKPAKVMICHRTDSTERPHVTLNISERAWKAHARHGDQASACPELSSPGK